MLPIMSIWLSNNIDILMDEWDLYMKKVTYTQQHDMNGLNWIFC